MKKKKIILIAVSLAILAGGGVWLFGGSTAKHKVTYDKDLRLSLYRLHLKTAKFCMVASF